MNAESPQLGRASAAFAMAAAIACVFNTALAWAKDAYAPLNGFMASLTGHHWITHGLADCIVFAGLGVVFMKTSATNKIGPDRLVSVLVWAVVAASIGLFAWYLFF
jgi:hypothetical protein